MNIPTFALAHDMASPKHADGIAPGSGKQDSQIFSRRVAQVSRDEGNEYHGASIGKVRAVLEALEGNLVSEIELQVRA